MSYDLPPDIERIVEAVQEAPSIFNTRPWWFEFYPPEHIHFLSIASMMLDAGSMALISTG